MHAHMTIGSIWKHRALLCVVRSGEGEGHCHMRRGRGLVEGGKERKRGQGLPDCKDWSNCIQSAVEAFDQVSFRTLARKRALDNYVPFAWAEETDQGGRLHLRLLLMLCSGDKHFRALRIVRPVRHLQGLASSCDRNATRKFPPEKRHLVPQSAFRTLRLRRLTVWCLVALHERAVTASMAPNTT